MKSDRERGHVGAWLRRERKSHDPEWTPEEVVRRLTEVGYPIRVDYYRSVEAGSSPSPELLEALERIHGSKPEPLPAASEDVGLANLVAALQAQTEAVTQRVAPGLTREEAAALIDEAVQPLWASLHRLEALLPPALLAAEAEREGDTSPAEAAPGRRSRSPSRGRSR